MGRPKPKQSDLVAKGNTSDTFGMDEMLEATASKTVSHLYSDATRTMYTGHVARGHEYLQNFNNGEFKDAISELSEQTPTAILAFIAFKCEREDKSFKTAEAIRSAFKQYFRDTHRCQGTVWQQESDGRWTGNPVYERTLTNYYTSLKKQYGRENVTRQSLPMSYQDLTVIMLYLQSPGNMFIQSVGKDFCLFFQAFAATGFCLWTRYVSCRIVLFVAAGSSFAYSIPYFCISRS
jgi:hypothetical protein